ncbi:MAG: lipopolysaccharide biosynthesis regulator YciM [Oleiphilaceae bacterium]|jgi:lipopolysaccharide biosynthesis regulator YciM
MDNGYVFLLVFLSLIIGWVFGFYAKPKKNQAMKSLNVSGDMKHRLQLLFDSYSDKSIDRFIQSLEVTHETLPLHISIGRHFRAQGEVEKAILVHQNLMSHPELSSKVSENIIYELARDYKAAGLFDRAQSLLHQLKSSKQFSVKSLKLLLDINEAEKDWNTAITEAARIDLKKNKDIALRVAQYHCEIADKFLKEGLVRESVVAYKQALTIYKGCYRAHLGLANNAFKNHDYINAIHHLKLLIGIAPEQITLTLPLLLSSTKATNSFKSHQRYLSKLLGETGQTPVMLAIVESMQAAGDVKAAVLFLFDYLQRFPSLAGMDRLFRLDTLADYSSQDLICLMAKVLETAQLDGQEYKCSSCGFSGSQLHWLCPSCKRWQAIKPVIEYEKDFKIGAV